MAPCVPAHGSGEFAKVWSACVPEAKVLTLPELGTLSNVCKPWWFGSLARSVHMRFEDMYAGSLKYIILGEMKVVIFTSKDLLTKMEVASPSDVPKDVPLASLCQTFIKTIGNESATSLKTEGSRIFAGTVSAGMVLYVPPGAFVCSSVSDAELHGVKSGMVTASISSREDLAAVNKVEPSKRLSQFLDLLAIHDAATPLQ